MTGPLIYRNIAQGTPEWHAVRAGKWSASKAAITMGGLDTKGIGDLVKTVAWERTYGPIAGGYKSPAMIEGTEREPEARDWYCFARGIAIEEVGFVAHATIPYVGWSPDGISERHGIEIKNPQHLAYMEVNRTKKIPAEYRWQTRWAMWVGELDSLDFIVYHPQAGGIIIPAEVTESEKQQMEERVEALERRVAEEISLLINKDAA